MSIPVYLIGVGGSGAKCVEAAIYLHTLGALGSNVRLGILLVDADDANGNVQRTRSILEKTLNCFDVFQQGPSEFVAGEVQNYGFWNPLADVMHSSNLANIFNQTLMKRSKPALGQLFDALYSPEEQQADLGVGFRGRPAIGSAVMSRVANKYFQQGPLQKLLEDIQNNCSNGDRPTVHIFGSVFGGTGASGVPTLATLLARNLQENSVRQSVRVNASLLLPYFDFDRPQDQDIYAETKNFTLNTDAALQYLTRESADTFDTVYLVGNTQKERYQGFTGGAQQENAAHFVELFAAMAVRDSYTQSAGRGIQAAYISRRSANELRWEDLPGQPRLKDSQNEMKQLLRKGVRFTYAWFYNFSLELDEARQVGSKIFAKGGPWLLNFFALNRRQDDLPQVDDPRQKNLDDILDDWSLSFLNWAQQVATSAGKSEQLFHLSDLGTVQLNRGYREHLAEVIAGEARPPKEASLDCCDTLKNQLADVKAAGSGVKGLVHSLFNLI